MCRKSWGSPRSRGLPRRNRFSRWLGRGGCEGSTGDSMPPSEARPAPRRSEGSRRDGLAKCKVRGAARMHFARCRASAPADGPGTAHAAAHTMDPIARLPQGAELRRFLMAQLQWERYHGARMQLVHAAAGGGAALWLTAAFRLPVPAFLLAAWAVCFLAAGFAGMMEWRWARRRKLPSGEP